MKTIQVTNEQIAIIKKALDFAYNSNLKIVETNRQIINENTIENIIKEANKFIDVQDVFDVEETNISSPEKYVLDLIEGVEPQPDIYGNVDWYKDGEWLFAQNFNVGLLDVSLNQIWSGLKIQFRLNNDEIQKLLTKVLYDYTDNGKLKVC